MNKVNSLTRIPEEEKSMVSKTLNKSTEEFSWVKQIQNRLKKSETPTEEYIILNQKSILPEITAKDSKESATGRESKSKELSFKRLTEVEDKSLDYGQGIYFTQRCEFPSRNFRRTFMNASKDRDPRNRTQTSSKLSISTTMDTGLPLMLISHDSRSPLSSDPSREILPKSYSSKLLLGKTVQFSKV
jgi:hypothetical protein